VARWRSVMDADRYRRDELGALSRTYGVCRGPAWTRGPRGQHPMNAHERRFDVVSAEQLEGLASQPLPLGLEATSSRVLFRDLYVDTDDDQLQRRGLTCRLRVGSDDRRILTVFVGTETDPAPPRRYEAAVESADPRLALESGTEPARRLAAA